MNQDPAKLSLSNFLTGESDDPLEAPASFTNWMRAGAWAVQLYEPELLASADARTVISYGGEPQTGINLCSYNYLGLANHPEVLAAAHEALRTHGLGACGSPMLSGMTDLHRELERRVAKFLGREDAMLFNSGFGGALGTISGLLRKTDVALLDNRSHLSLRDGAVLSRCRTEKFEHNDAASLDAALSRQRSEERRVGKEGGVQPSPPPIFDTRSPLSLRDGAVLSRCRTEKFEHNDAASLDAALSRQKGRRQLVIVEGIYSMDGDFGNLTELLAVAESHGASVFIDEAHSMLACGEHGRGAAEMFGVEDRGALLYCTFSQAFGALGGFVAGSKETLQYLRFYAHPYVYSCALPPVVIAAILKALELGTSQPELRAKLWENADYFHAQLDKLGFNTGASTTYVMPIVIGDRELMYRLGDELGRAGVWGGRG